MRVELAALALVIMLLIAVVVSVMLVLGLVGVHLVLLVPECGMWNPGTHSLLIKKMQSNCYLKTIRGII